MARVPSRRSRMCLMYVVRFTKMKQNRIHFCMFGILFGELENKTFFFDSKNIYIVFVALLYQFINSSIFQNLVATLYIQTFCFQFCML